MIETDVIKQIERENHTRVNFGAIQALDSTDLGNYLASLSLHHTNTAHRLAEKITFHGLVEERKRLREEAKTSLESVAAPTIAASYHWDNWDNQRRLAYLAKPLAALTALTKTPQPCLTTEASEIDFIQLLRKPGNAMVDNETCSFYVDGQMKFSPKTLGNFDASLRTAGTLLAFHLQETMSQSSPGNSPFPLVGKFYRIIGMIPHTEQNRRGVPFVQDTDAARIGEEIQKDTIHAAGSRLQLCKFSGFTKKFAKSISWTNSLAPFVQPKTQTSSRRRKARA